MERPERPAPGADRPGGRPRFCLWRRRGRTFYLLASGRPVFGADAQNPLFLRSWARAGAAAAAERPVLEFRHAPPEQPAWPRAAAARLAAQQGARPAGRPPRSPALAAGEWPRRVEALPAIGRFRPAVAGRQAKGRLTAAELAAARLEGVRPRWQRQARGPQQARAGQVSQVAAGELARAARQARAAEITG